MKQTCIFVLGMHRSGTSALTGILSMLDIYLAKTTKGDNSNEKGYFENTKIQELNDDVFLSINSSWDDDFFNIKKLDEFNNNIDRFKVIIEEDFKYSSIFAIKDPRICFLFPIWEKVLKDMDIDIKVILPYRNPIEVANSLNKRNDMPLEKSILLWAYHFLLAEKFSRGYDRVFINFDDLISNPSIAVESISEKLKLNLNEIYSENKNKINDFLEPSLKHHNISINNLSCNVPKVVQDILKLKNYFNNTNLAIEFDFIRNEVFSYQSIFYNTSIVSSLDYGLIAQEKLYIKEIEVKAIQESLDNTLKELNKIQKKLLEKEYKLDEVQYLLLVKEQKLAEEKNHLLEKNQELEKTKNILINKEHEINIIRNDFNMQEIELEDLKCDFTNIYISNCWKITRPLRRIMRKLKNDDDIKV